MDNNIYSYLQLTCPYCHTTYQAFTNHTCKGIENMTKQMFGLATQIGLNILSTNHEHKRKTNKRTN